MLKKPTKKQSIVLLPLNPLHCHFVFQFLKLNFYITAYFTKQICSLFQLLAKFVYMSKIWILLLSIEHYLPITFYWNFFSKLDINNLTNIQCWQMKCKIDFSISFQWNCKLNWHVYNLTAVSWRVFFIDVSPMKL